MYELSLWTHDDIFLSLLKGQEEFLGQAYNISFNKKVSGEKTLSFEIPLYTHNAATDSEEISYLWQQIRNDYKVRLIVNKGELDEEVHDFAVSRFDEGRDGQSKIGMVNCGGYSLYELNKIGFGAELNEDSLEEDGVIAAASINFWMGRILPFTRNEYHPATNPSGWKFTGKTLYEKDNIVGFNKEYDSAAMQTVWVPQYGEEQIEKERIIKVSQSNVFNMLQEVAEKFQVWVDFVYTYDEYYRTIGREIVFHEDVSVNSTYSFDYGLNLQKITRNTDTSDLITKMYVKPVESEFEDDMLMNISDAAQNLMGEEYLYNFEYFLANGLITDAQYANSIVVQSAVRDINLQIKPLQANLINKQRILNETLANRDFAEFQRAGAEQALKNLQNELGMYPSDAIEVKQHPAFLRKVGGLFVVDLSYRKGLISSSFVNFKNHMKEAISVSPVFIYSPQDASVITGFSLASNPDVIPKSTTTTNGSSTATVANNTGLYAGMEITNNATRIAAGTTITKVEGTTITLSKPAIGSGTASTGYTAYQIYFDYQYHPYAYTMQLIDSEAAKVKSFGAQMDKLQNEAENLQITINSLTETLGHFKDDKETLIANFEKSMPFAIREGKWEETDYQLKKKSNNISNVAIQKTGGAATNYSLTANLNAIDLDSIQLWKKSGTKYVYQYSQYSDYTLEYGTVGNTGTGTLSLLFCPTDSGAFALNALIGDSTLVGENASLYVKYRLHGSSSFESEKKVDRGSNYIWNRYFDITVDNLITHSLRIYPTFSGAAPDTEKDLPLKEGVDYSLSTSYDLEGKLKTTVELKPSQDAVHLATYKLVEMAVNDTLQYFYYDVAEVLQRSSFPNVSYDIDVVDLSSLGGFEDFKPEVGHRVFIFDKELGFEGLEGFIAEIDYPDLDDPTLNKVVISNFKTKFEDMFQRIVATTESARSRELLFETLGSIITPKRTLRLDVIENSLRDNFYSVAIGTSSSLVWDASGITATDTSGTDPVPGVVKYTGKGIFLSSEIDVIGNRIWSTGITGYGINASVITSGQIDTKKLIIYNASQPRFAWTADGLFAYGYKFSGETDFDTFVRMNEAGLLFQRLIDGGTGDERAETELSLTWEGLAMGVQGDSLRITSEFGLQVFSPPDQFDNRQERIQLGRLTGTNSYGMRLTNSQGAPVMETDDEGDLWLKNLLTVGNSAHSTVGLYGGGSDINEIGIWAGSSFANRLTAPFRVDYEGNFVAFSGAIAGWILSENELYKGSGSSKIALNSLLGKIYVGAGTYKSGDTAFYVDADGQMSLSDKLFFSDDELTIDGKLQSTEGYFGGAANGVQINSNGLSIVGTGEIVSGKVRMKSDRVLIFNASDVLQATLGYNDTAYGIFAGDSSLTSAGLTINGTSSSINLGSGAFTVNGLGQLVATSATITGTINATGGNFTNTITVGSDTVKLNLSGTNDKATTAFYSTGALYKNTGIWLDASERFSLGNGLFYSPAEGLNITGTIVGSTFKTHANTGNGSTAGVIIDGSSARFYNALSSTPLTTISTSTGILSGTNVNLSGSIQSGTFGSGVSGWRIDNAGNAEFENITARGVLKSTVFIYDEINAQGGNLLIAPASTLAEDTVKGAGATTWTFKVKNTYPGQPYIFNVGDTLRIQTYINDQQIALWLKITVRGANSGDTATYTADILSSSIVGVITVLAGTAVVKYGVQNGGHISLVGDDLTNGPFIDIIKNEGANVHESINRKVQVRLGNLGGITDDPYFGNSLTGYGLYAQNAYLTGTVALPDAGLTNHSVSGLDNVRIWAGGDYDDVLANPTNLKFKVHESGKVVMGSGASPAFTFVPSENKIELGGSTTIGWSSIMGAPDIEDVYQVVITGTDIAVGDSQTILVATVYKNGVDITAGVAGGELEWFLGSTSKGTGKTKAFLDSEVHGSALVKCEYTP